MGGGERGQRKSQLRLKPDDAFALGLSLLLALLPHPSALAKTRVLKAKLGSPRGSPPRALLSGRRPKNLPP